MIGYLDRKRNQNMAVFSKFLKYQLHQGDPLPTYLHLLSTLPTGFLFSGLTDV